jgi:hypothetical protein
VVENPNSSLGMPNWVTRLAKANRGCSSVGRAVALQAIGQEFESPQLHQL